MSMYKYFLLGFFFCLVPMQYALHGMEVDATDSSKSQKLNSRAREVVKFLSIVEVEHEKSEEIIAYFNQKDSGIPICKKLENKTVGIAESCKLRSRLYSLFTSIVHDTEKTVFGYRLADWMKIMRIEMHRHRGNYVFNPCIDKLEEDKQATALVQEFRSRLKLSDKLRIPVYKRPFSELEFFWSDVSSHMISDGDLCCFITMNSYLNKKYPATIRYRLAHEIAHIERGVWAPYRNLLLTQITFGTLGGLAGYILTQNKEFEYSWVKPYIYGMGILEGLIIGSCFKNYFKRQEEKACDLRSIELCDSDDGVEECYLLDSKIQDKYTGDGWIIKELTITKQEKPSEYSWSYWLAINGGSYYSHAERVRYCKEYAQKLMIERTKKAMAEKWRRSTYYTEIRKLSGISGMVAGSVDHQ